MDDNAIVAAGLVIGLLARWAVVLSLGQSITRRVILIDLLVLSMNGLLARLFGQELNLHHVKLAVEAAMLGASSTIVFAKMQGEWLKRNTGTPVQFAGGNESIRIEPSPAGLEVHTVDEDSPQNTQEVMEAALELLRSVPGNPFAELLDKLNKID